MKATQSLRNLVRASDSTKGHLTQSWTPGAHGKLVALYEHSEFTQGAIWNDSFNQRGGFELGKVLDQRIIPELESEAEPRLEQDSSTNSLIRRYRGLKETSQR